ncbi:toxin glutamine deamidase domain-containing protein [Solihabitans fulvus]|uniref:toxin glutamine deamidase domain-containing protein n=1 Tax=Solihabitans fulvus TaxID=1892852 RepID=UPI0016621901|nr:toxin glutamine deamidase domain-containing protein [Solihabitans fulvus]
MPHGSAAPRATRASQLPSGSAAKPAATPGQHQPRVDTGHRSAPRTSIGEIGRSTAGSVRGLGEWTAGATRATIDVGHVFTRSTNAPTGRFLPAAETQPAADRPQRPRLVAQEESHPFYDAASTRPASLLSSDPARWRLLRGPVAGITTRPAIHHGTAVDLVVDRRGRWPGAWHGGGALSLDPASFSAPRPDGYRYGIDEHGRHHKVATDGRVSTWGPTWRTVGRLDPTGHRVIGPDGRPMQFDPAHFSTPDANGSRHYRDQHDTDHTLGRDGQLFRLDGAPVWTPTGALTTDDTKGQRFLREELPGFDSINRTQFEDRKPGHDINCNKCVLATDALLSGFPGQATASYPSFESYNVLHERYEGTYHTMNSYDELIQHMEQHGGRGVVQLGRTDGTGHVFNVVRTPHGIVFLDAQTGTLGKLEPRDTTNYIGLYHYTPDGRVPPLPMLNASPSLVNMVNDGLRARDHGWTIPVDQGAPLNPIDDRIMRPPLPLPRG